MTEIEIVKFTASFRKGILGKRSPHQMCYAVCDPLYCLLVSLGEEVELISGEIRDEINGWWGHFWLKLPSGNIIDPTASQFRNETGDLMPDIYYGEKPNFYIEHN